MKTEKKLFKYQQNCITHLLDKKRAMLALDMGLGKTFTSLMLWKQQNQNHQQNIWNKEYKVSTIIICQSKKLTDWKNEVELVFPNKKVDIIKTSKDLKLTHPFFNFECDFIIMSYQIFTKITTDRTLKFWKDYLKNIIINNLYASTIIDSGLIFDESQTLKSPTSKISKYLMKLAPELDRVLLLSGDPISTGYKDLYPQMKILKCFPQDYYFKDFKDDYCLTSDVWGVHNVEIITGYKNTDKLMDILNKKAFFMKTEQAYDLPDQTFRDEIIADENIHYDEYAHERCISFKHDKKEYQVLSNGILADFTTLRQLSSGFINYFNDENIKSTKSLNTNKLDFLEEMLNTMNKDNPIVIFYNFKQELKDIKDRLSHQFKIIEINGEHNPNISDIEKTSNTLICVQYLSGAKGIDGLQYLTNRVIYYSPTLSGELYKQSIKRVHRIGQKNKCIYHRLINTSLEKEIYKKISKFEDFTDDLFKNFLEGSK